MDCNKWPWVKQDLKICLISGEEGLKRGLNVKISLFWPMGGVIQDWWILTLGTLLMSDHWPGGTRRKGYPSQGRLGIFYKSWKWGLNTDLKQRWGQNFFHSLELKNGLVRNLMCSDPSSSEHWQSCDHLTSRHMWDVNCTLNVWKWEALSHLFEQLLMDSPVLSELPCFWTHGAPMLPGSPQDSRGSIRGVLTSLPLHRNILCTLNLTLFLGSSKIIWCGFKASLNP